MSNKETMNRRSFLGIVAALGATAAGSSLVGCSPGGSTTGSSTPEEKAYAVDSAEQWYGSAPTISDADVVETIEVDVLVCGSGHSGTACAMTLGSLEAGKVLVIEKNATVGVGRTYIGAIDTTAQKEAGANCDKLYAVNDLARYASNRCDERLLKLWADNSGEAIDFMASELAEYGITHVAETDRGEGYHGIYEMPNVHTKFIVPENGNFLTYMQQKAEGYGVEFRFETPLVSLIKDDSGKVAGAYAKTAEGYLKINAGKGVILATGGYANDADLLQKLNPVGQETVILDTSATGNAGDGIKAGIWAGGIKDAVPTAMIFDRGIGAPRIRGGYPYEGAGFFMNFGSQPFLRTTYRGERFCNEAAPYDFTLHSAWVASPEHVCCTFWDANYYENVEAFHTVGCSRIVPSNAVPETQEGGGKDAMNTTLEMYEGLIQKADTWEELAEKLGIPADTLTQTIDRYNELAGKGVDEDFGKPAKDLIALKTPPFYGVVLGGTLLTTMDGLRIDTNLNVVDAEAYEPIEGLYAIGDASGAFFCNNYPELYVGVASGRSLTWAYLAAKGVAKA
jgi:succinate dehydrogenase/fumarate reductase flavoprotein subunit